MTNPARDIIDKFYKKEEARIAKANRKAKRGSSGAAKRTKKGSKRLLPNARIGRTQ